MVKWPEEVVESIARRRTVLYLGAGVSKNSIGRDDKRPATWAEFLDLCIARCPPPTGHIRRLLNREDYLTACEVLKARLDEDFARVIKEEFADPKYKPAAIHEEIFKLDVNIVATPNVDKIYDTYAQAASSNTVKIKQYHDDDVASVCRERSRIVLKVHGTIDQPSKMIFTRSEYARSRVAYGAFYEVLRALLVTNTFVFLGCGIADPDIRLLLEQGAHMHSFSKPHYVVMPKGTIHQEVQAALRASMNVKVIQYNPADGHAELTRAVGELVSKVEDLRDEMAGNLDW
jgi:SIR2-like domain